LVSVIVENSDAVRLEVNPVCRIRLDRGASVSISDSHRAILYEDTVRGIRGDNGARIQDGGPATEDGDTKSRIVGNYAAKDPRQPAEHLHAIARVRPNNSGAGDKCNSAIDNQDTGIRIALDRSLPPALSELAICITARHLRASYEWHAHAPLAVEAGVPAAAIEAIRTGATPSFTAIDQALVHRVIAELIDTKRLTDATFAEAIERFGEQGIVELGTIVGSYTAIGNALNAFQVPLPAGAPQPFPE